MWPWTVPLLFLSPALQPAGVIQKVPGNVCLVKSSAGYTGVNSAGRGLQIKGTKHVTDWKRIFRFKQIKEMQLEMVED